MNSAKIKFKRRFLTFFLLFFLSFALTACDVDTIPEWIAGKVIKAILERDYDLIYNTGDETAEIPDYTQPSWESPELPSEPSESAAGEEDIPEEEPSTEETDEEDQAQFLLRRRVPRRRRLQRRWRRRLQRRRRQPRILSRFIIHNSS